MFDRRQFDRERYQRRKEDPNFMKRQMEVNRRAIERKALALAEQITKANGWDLHQGYTAAERGQPFDKEQNSDWRQGWRIWTRRHGKAA